MDPVQNNKCLITIYHCTRKYFLCAISKQSKFLAALSFDYCSQILLHLDNTIQFLYMIYAKYIPCLWWCSSWWHIMRRWTFCFRNDIVTQIQYNATNAKKRIVSMLKPKFLMFLSILFRTWIFQQFSRFDV